MSDSDLEAALYANHGTKRGYRRHAEPDWLTVHRELKRKHVTLVIVWDEYIAANPGGYSYSRFCELYRGFESKLSPTMRQTHAAGERLFVDYAGDGVPVVIDRLTGEIRKAQIFVAVLGASSFTFAHASWTQALPDWIDAHVRALEVIGGVPHLLVPDNTKTAVIKACLYDPQVNRTYAEMAAHYDTAILPARPRRPRDKAKVEQAVLIVERWLLGRLRHRTFYSQRPGGPSHSRKGPAPWHGRTENSEESSRLRLRASRLSWFRRNSRQALTRSRLPRGHSSMPTWSCTCRTASRPRPSGSTVARSIRKARSTSSWRPTRRSPRNTPRRISSAAEHHRPCMTPRSRRTSGSRLGQPPGRLFSFPAAIEG